MTSAAGPKEILRIEKLSMRFGGLAALSDVNFSVRSGQIFSVIGPNGAGKTTLFNAITGIYDPTEGKVLFDSRDLRQQIDARRLGFMVALGFFCALGALISFNLASLWEAAIINNYAYRQPFPWSKIPASVSGYFSSASWLYTALPAMLGGAIGFGASYAIWLRGSRAPEVVARAGINRTFQNIRLFPEMSVLDNVLVGMDSRLKTRFWESALRLPIFYREQRSASESAAKILEFVDLAHYAQQPASSLPYGHQRRLEIARALASEPSVLLLDEPAAGMNPSESQDLMDLIFKIRDQGTTVLLIEHHMRVVMGISDEIVVLDYGNKIAQGTPDEIRRDPKVIEAYLGKQEI